MEKKQYMQPSTQVMVITTKYGCMADIASTRTYNITSGTPVLVDRGHIKDDLSTSEWAGAKSSNIWEAWDE